MPRFVILIHDHPFLHWDLMLETPESLATWRLHQKPKVGQENRAEALPEHRKAYLDYEGPVSNNRGTVTRWDAGTYSVQEWTESNVRCELIGQQLLGVCQLTKKLCADQSTEWTFLVLNPTEAEAE